MAQPSAGTRLGGRTTGLTRDVSRVIPCALSQYQHRGSLTTTVGHGREYSRLSEFIHSRSDSRRCSAGHVDSASDLSDLCECLLTVGVYAHWLTAGNDLAAVKASSQVSQPNRFVCRPRLCSPLSALIADVLTRVCIVTQSC